MCESFSDVNYLCVPIKIYTALKGCRITCLDTLEFIQVKLDHLVKLTKPNIVLQSEKHNSLKPSKSSYRNAVSMN